jgi:hypothetical protein
MMIEFDETNVDDFDDNCHHDRVYTSVVQINNANTENASRLLLTVKGNVKEEDKDKFRTEFENMNISRRNSKPNVMIKIGILDSDYKAKKPRKLSANVPSTLNNTMEQDGAIKIINKQYYSDNLLVPPACNSSLNYISTKRVSQELSLNYFNNDENLNPNFQVLRAKRRSLPRKIKSSKTKSRKRRSKSRAVSKRLTYGGNIIRSVPVSVSNFESQKLITMEDIHSSHQ